jgi:hypothetical protein
LIEEIVLSGSAPLDLNKVGWREDRAEEAEIENVGTVVTRGHHAYRNADPRLAGFIGGKEIARSKQVVVGEVYGELLGIGYLRGNLHGKVRLVLAGEHQIGHLVEYLCKFGGMVLADGKYDCLADLSAHRVAQAVLQKRFAEDLVCGV